MNTGWLSIVENRNSEETLLVRARSLKHILNVFPDCDHFKDRTADYPYRAYIAREEVGSKIMDALLNINYDNFKNSVEDGKLHSAYELLWGDIAMSYHDER